MAVLQPGSRKDVFIDLTEGAALLPCEIAAVPDGQKLDPAAATWWAAEPDSDDTVRILVGPGGTAELAPGDYILYVRITNTPQIPIEESGPLKIL